MKENSCRYPMAEPVLADVDNNVRIVGDFVGIFSVALNQYLSMVFKMVI